MLFGSFVVFLAALLVLKFSKKNGQRERILSSNAFALLFYFCLLLSFIITSAYFDFICCDSGWVLLLSLLGLFLALLIALLVLKFSKKNGRKKLILLSNVFAQLFSCYFFYCWL